jgi:hypothetical protein
VCLFFENSTVCHLFTMPCLFFVVDVPTPVGTIGQVFGFFFGEFDPGSGRTLAACLTHASRTDHPLRGVVSGERVSNTWVTCPRLWDNSGKPGLIPDMIVPRMGCGGKGFWSGMGPRPISLLVG